MKPPDCPSRPEQIVLAGNSASVSNQTHRVYHPTVDRISSGVLPDHTDNKRTIGLCPDSGSEVELKMKLLSALLPSASKLETCGPANHICNK